MVRRTGTVVDQQNIPLPGALVLVQVTSTGALAALADDSGAAIVNPITADALGAFVYNIADGYYDETFLFGGRTILVNRNLRLGTPPVNPDIVRTANGGGAPSLNLSSAPQDRVLSISSDGSQIIDIPVPGGNQPIAPVTLLGNNSNATATPSALTAGQAKSVLALDQVNNTSDLAKPVSTAVAAALVPKVDAPGALAAAVGAAAMQAPARSALISAGATPGASLVGYIASPSSAVARTALDKWREHGALTPEDFGYSFATGVSQAANDAALQAWLDALADGTFGKLGPLDYKFATPLTKSGDRVSIRGSGKASRLLYVGAPTTINLLTIGSPTTETRGYRLRDFVIDSTTPMTGGAAFKAYNLCRSRLGDVIFGGQEGYGNLWDGGDFEGVDYVWIDESDVYVRGTGLKVSVRHNSTYAYGVGFYVRGGKIGGCGQYGVLVGGGMGGVVLDDIDIIANGQSSGSGTYYAGVKVDNSLYAMQNREVIFGKGCSIDSNKGYGLWLNDTLNNMPPTYITLDGTWVASSSVSNIYIQALGAAGAALPSVFSHIGGTNFNCAGDGLNVATTLPVVQSVGVLYRYNVGFGVRGSGASNVQLRANRYLSNTAGDTVSVTIDDQTFPQDIHRDPNFYLGLAGSSPVINFNPNAFIQYDRNSSVMSFYTNGGQQMYLQSDGLHCPTVTTNGPKLYSSGGQPVVEFGSNTFISWDGSRINFYVAGQCHFYIDSSGMHTQ